ncbi:hypothetical protein CDL12_13845 [Handroanthus impetiginosus]|uniref:Uncharacterized protein n=1 Tax=Handroanthus impetiginosus TaxID=429701 RepID=A0A2G9H7S3_9LAMI|nr:hypothetical protein CDL12_13845 [Handroanthus impetiginosus]
MASEYVSEREKEMLRSTHLDLNATDSQVLGSLDSVSLLSEPPDVRNWFPSYVYESPDLNTLDGVLDFDESGGTCLEEEKKRKSGENRLVGEFSDGLLPAAKESTDGIVKCNESNEFECSKSAAMVPELSESLSLASEPPDIKNWFSSYSYESPLLDTHEFTIFDHKDGEDGHLCSTQKSCPQDNKDVIDFMDIEDGAELPNRSRISNAVVKSINMVKDVKLDCQSVCKDGHNDDLKPIPAISRQSTSKKVSEKILPGQRTENNNQGSVNKFSNTNKNGEDFGAMLNGNLINRANPNLLKMENIPSSEVGKCVHKSTGMKDCVNHSLEKEDLHQNGSPRGDLRRPTGTSSGKENEGNGFLENGFVSTRKKSSQTNTGIVTRPVNGVKSEFNREKDAAISRKVLSDTTNFHSTDVVESTGKWLCPQKRKPNLGPPLKQLRLERWVRRV